jgi:cyclophilin family peptidyl-prolyl cis-trans isomerase
MTVKFLILGLFCLFALGSAVRAANPVVVMETSKGTIEIELFEDKAPITVKNFLDYVADKHYDGLIFHRVIENFMIQGGGFEPGLTQKKTKPTIKNEASNGLSNLRGTIAMARTSVPDSATSQFFINVKDNKGLDRSGNSDEEAGYCVFGRVIKGMETVDDIRKVPTERKSGYSDVPKDDVVIKSVKVKK